jgi:hypothetical protein
MRIITRLLCGVLLSTVGLGALIPSPTDLSKQESTTPGFTDVAESPSSTQRGDKDHTAQESPLIRQLLDERAEGRSKGYLRLPVRRHFFNKTDRSGHHGHGKGPLPTPISPQLHVVRQQTKPWGWGHLEDLGGIAYIIERKLYQDRPTFYDYFCLPVIQYTLGHRRR